MKRRVLAGFGVAAFIVAATAAIALWSSVHAFETTHLAAHSHEVFAALESTRGSVTDAQVHARGYAVSGDARYLKAYARGKGAAHTSIGRLVDLIAEDPLQEALAAQLRPLAATAFAQFDVLLEERRPGASDRSSGVPADDTIMDSFRGVEARMHAAEEARLASRIAESESMRAMLPVVCFILAAAALALLASQYVRLARVMDERGRAEAEAARRERLLRAIVEGTTDAVFLKDGDGRYTMINAAGAALLSRPVEEVVGKDDRQLMSPETAASTRMNDASVLDTGATRTYEDAVTIAGVTKVYQSTKGPLFDADGRVTGLFGISRDITQRKAAEARLVELNRDLARRSSDAEAANRELEAFAHSVSHDLRAPLRHIGGFVELLEQRAAATFDVESRRCVDTIARAARHMSALIDDLLAFSRMSRGEMHQRTVDVGALVRGVVEEAKRASPGRDIEWVVRDLPTVRGDPAMLRLALVNLVENAVKYTRPRWRARIEIGCESGPDGDPVIFVKDDGVGFDEAYAGKLFGVFQRLHRTEEFEGTGIGLANVRRIVERHGGRTFARGTVGEGATVGFSLPRQAEGVSP